MPANRISFAVDLTPLAESLAAKGQNDVDHLTFLGSALFTRRVSGPRVVLCAQPAKDGAPDGAPEAPAAPQDGTEPAALKVKGKYKKTIDGTPFQSYGAHADTYSCCYLTAACALGATREEMEAFLTRLEGALQDYRKGAGRKEKESAPKAKGG